MGARIPSRLRDTSGISVQVDLEAKEARALFQRLKERGSDLSPAMSEIAEVLTFEAQLAFENEASPAGAKWQPLARRTLKRLRKGRTSPKILRDRGFLADSIVGASDDRTAIAGSNLVYARIHQLGGVIDMPAREGTARFRMAKEGAGTRKDKDGNIVRYGSKLRFASKRHKKGVWEDSFEVGAYQIPIPARPYLGLGPEAWKTVEDILKAHLGEELTS